MRVLTAVFMLPRVSRDEVIWRVILGSVCCCTRGGEIDRGEFVMFIPDTVWDVISITQDYPLARFSVACMLLFLM